MRRLAALLLMFIIPLQFSWSVAAGVHGHVGGEWPMPGMHAHALDHDHPDASPETGLADDPASDVDSHHDEDGHHACHCHHVLSFILMDSAPRMAGEATNGLIPHTPAAYLPNIPPLFDRPPLTLA